MNPSSATTEAPNLASDSTFVSTPGSVTPPPTTEPNPALGFVDRRQNRSTTSAGIERRQFGNSYTNLSPEARELAEAIDGYKVQHRRRYVTYEEMLQVIQALGYHR